jgi:iron complex outermembrane receptor protein
VINFVLRDDDSGGQIEAQYGQYYEEGEQALMLSGWKGFRLGNDGFINFSFEWKDDEQLIRSTQRPGAQDLVDQGIRVGLDNPYSNDKPDRAQTWGKPDG